METDVVALPREQLAAFCKKWEVSELALFGSILREDFGPDSDIDVLVTFSPASTRTLLDEARMEMELEKVLGRKVDLVDREAVEQSHNWLRREKILEATKRIYAAS